MKCSQCLYKYVLIISKEKLDGSPISNGLDSINLNKITNLDKVVNQKMFYELFSLSHR